MPAVFNSLPVFEYPYKEWRPARHHVSQLMRATNVGMCKFYLETLVVISTFEFPGVQERVILHHMLMQSMWGCGVSSGTLSTTSRRFWWIKQRMEKSEVLRAVLMMEIFSNVSPSWLLNTWYLLTSRSISPTDYFPCNSWSWRRTTTV
jgi:hypothetical protein